MQVHTPKSWGYKTRARHIYQTIVDATLKNKHSVYVAHRQSTLGRSSYECSECGGQGALIRVESLTPDTFSYILVGDVFDLTCDDVNAGIVISALREM